LRQGGRDVDLAVQDGLKGLGHLADSEALRDIAMHAGRKGKQDVLAAFGSRYHGNPDIREAFPDGG
jgi:hypothetical protein